jgi:hypothetical protein
VDNTIGPSSASPSMRTWASASRAPAVAGDVHGVVDFGRVEERVAGRVGVRVEGGVTVMRRGIHMGVGLLAWGCRGAWLG